MNFLIYSKKYWKEIIIGVEIIVIITLIVLLYNKRNCQNEEIQSNLNNDISEIINIEETITEEIIEERTIMIDIKGAVKKPGVYELKENSIVQDAIKAAGGLKSNATTSNINLSKKLNNEAVIKIYTTSELNKKEEQQEIKECTTSKIEITECDTPIIESTNKEDIILKEETNNKISINTATKEELMQLNGIGESKAQSIIDYRNNISKFNTIEDIKNVSGIGDAAFEKIKDYITI